jgi:hypothetical protein
MNQKYKPRLSVEIPEESLLALRSHLPIGFQKTIYNLITDDLILLLNKFGANQVMAAFCAKDITLEKMCRLKVGGKNDHDTQPESINKRYERRTSFDSFTDSPDE